MRKSMFWAAMNRGLGEKEVAQKRLEKSDYDAWIEMIDAKIAELEAMEAEKEPKKKGIEVHLLTAGPGQLWAIAQIQRFFPEVSYREARAIVANLPYTFRFENRTEATFFIHSLAEVDAIAVFGPDGE